MFNIKGFVELSNEQQNEQLGEMETSQVLDLLADLRRYAEIVRSRKMVQVMKDSVK